MLIPARQTPYFMVLVSLICYYCLLVQGSLSYVTHPHKHFTLRFSGLGVSDLHIKSVIFLSLLKDCICACILYGFFFYLLLKVATFILQKILLDETGLAYICQTYERFSHVAMILVIYVLVCIHFFSY